MITRDLRYLVVAAAAQVGRDGKGAGGLLGYLEHLAARKALPPKLLKLQAARFVAIAVEKEIADG